MADNGSGLVESYDGHAVYFCVSQQVDIRIKVFFGFKVGARRVVGDLQGNSYAVFNQTVFQSLGEAQPVGVVQVKNPGIRDSRCFHQVGHLNSLESV